jgi:23S rRNA (adenine2503-C2)-methyltransferase
MRSRAGAPPQVLGLTSPEFASLVEGAGLAGARSPLALRLYRAVHREGSSTLEGVAGVGRARREAAHGLFSTGALEPALARPSWDRSVHYAFRLGDGAVVESVLLPHHGRWTACVSSQAGCALACTFCATGRLGLLRNLRASEIVAQVHAIARHSGHRISDLVFMGMGEPLQNEDEVIRACTILADPHGAQISRRRMVISTAGVVPAIHRYAAAAHRMPLVFSLASADPDKRARLMPIQRRYGFDAFLDAVRTYARSRGGRHVTLEYLAIAGLTLGEDDVLAIRRHLTGFRFILNVIPLNPVDPELRPPLMEEVHAFTDRLRPLGFPVKIRRSFGRDRTAGCGQLGTMLLDAGAGAVDAARALP